MCSWIIWLPPLLLLMLQVLSASPVDLQSGHAHNRTTRDQDCYEDEYEYKGLCCRNCRAGTYVVVPCAQNHLRGTCKSCIPGQSFTAFSNGLDSCLPCSTCTEDKVLVQNCTPKSDAKCECKPGYYCTPDEPCEICNRCSSCREGQRVKKPCTSTTNTVCVDVSAPELTSTKAIVKGKETVLAPKESSSDVDGIRSVPVTTNSFKDETGIKPVPTEPPDDPASSRTSLYVIIPIVLTGLFALFLGFYLCKRWSRDNNKNTLINNSQTTSASASLSSIPMDVKVPIEKESCPESQRLMTPPSQEPKKVEKLINVSAMPYMRVAQSETPENNAAHPPGGDVENEESPQLGEPCRECDKTPPCDCQWVIFIYVVIDGVPSARILELVRKLNLNKSTIDQILRDNPNNCKEQSYKLLEEWRSQKGTQASMRAVLHVLKDMDLGGRCENIVNSLRTKSIRMN